METRLQGGETAAWGASWYDALAFMFSSFVATNRWVTALGAVTWAVGCGQPGETSSVGSSGGTGGADGGRGGSEALTTGGTGGSEGGTSGATGSMCSEDADCSVEMECYTAACEGGICLLSAADLGTECSTGVCKGIGAAAQCVPCVDNAAAPQPDAGCPPASPVCDESASVPACVQCKQDSDCSDDIECTVDTCTDSVCESEALPAGSECGRGVCNGQPDEDSCVPCIDDADAGLDTGCTTEQPACDTSQTPATCIGCISADDCEDDNDCTVESCEDGVCEHATVLAGTPCTGGFCDGVAGMESCVVVECETDSDCDDGVDCTEEACTEDQVCSYTTNHSECTDSGDACVPNLCGVEIGCREVDISKSVELLSNGNLDSDTDDWMMTSVNYDRVIFADDYVPRLTAHSPPNVAWLGGGEANPDEQNSLSQRVHVPAGTTTLELSFAYQIHAEDLPDNHNQSQIYLRATEASQTDREILTFYNQDKPLEDETLDWTWSEYGTTLDGTEWAGSDVILEFTGTGIDGYTHFFYDSISLIATVCE